MNAVWFPDDRVPDPAALALDRAARFGMSVFETVAVRNGNPLFFLEHLDRLKRASHELLGAFPKAALEASSKASSSLGGETGVLRIYATAGPGGPDSAVTSPGGFAIFESADVGSGPGSGVGLTLCAAPYSAAPGGWKTGNYWANIRALTEARRAGCGDAVLLSPCGEVVSTAIANLFASSGGRLLTPHRESGARDGVVREWVLAKTGAEETCLDPETLLAAEEIFVTNSRIGILSVARLDGRDIPGRALAEALSSSYRDEIFGG